MNEQLKNLWSEFINLHNSAHLEDPAPLNPPATQQDFEEFKSVTGFELPDDLKVIYMQNNGQADGTGLFLGLEFCSIQNMLKQWKSWQETRQDIESGHLTGMNDFCTSTPENAIKLEYTNAKWIPMLYDYAGNHIGPDLDPAEQGKIGQIINFGTDDEEKDVLADNLEEFLKLCIELYKDPEAWKNAEDTHLTSFLIKRRRDSAKIK